MVEVTVIRGIGVADWITAVAAAVASVATVGLIAVACVQLRGIRLDARARFLPLLSVQRVLIDREGRIRAWLQNTGDGPASNIRLRVWVRAEADYLAGRELIEAGEGFWEEARTRDPDFEHVIGSIAAGQREAPIYVGRGSGIEGGERGFGLFVYNFEHQDIFGRDLPRTPPEERQPGFAAIVPEWNAEFMGAPLAE